MACPFFFPEQKLDDGRWLHPGRLPLGAGWSGRCLAPRYEGQLPSDEELHQFCNLGYASGCRRFPKERSSDAVRFSVARDCGDRVVLFCVFELAHRPAGHSNLEYDCASGQWLFPHPVARIEQMAKCYLDSYMLKRSSRQVLTSIAGASSVNND